jgi:TonB-dependent starch-binding outer membrane protein SusC
MPRLSTFRLLFTLAAIFFSTCLFAQKTVTGIVKDKDGPLVGATVMVKGTTITSVSGSDGKFSIVMPKGRSTVIVSTVGYITKEVQVGEGETSFEVSLASGTNALDEVYITGYTAQKKKDLTGAVSIVKASDLTKVAAPSFAQQIEGRASGVSVTTAGSPGEGASIRIRGISTFNAGGGEPLVILDGVQFKGPYFNDINPNDIESIQVLKDAATTSQYGIGASNGVIIITTKKGKAGQPKIEYSGYYGVQTAVNRLDDILLSTSAEYMDVVYKSYKNNGQWPLAAGTLTARIYGIGPKPVLPDYVNPLPAVAGGGPVNPGTYSYPNNLIMRANKQGTNWWEAIMQEGAPITEHNISASGGTDKGKYFLSFNYFDQQGTMRFTDFNRITVRANTEFKVKNFTFGESMSAGFQNSVGQPNGNQSEQNVLLSGIVKMQPMIPVYDEGGNWGGTKAGFGNGRNGLAELTRNQYNRGEFFKLIGNIYAEIRFLDHFSAKVNFGLNYGTNFFNGFTSVDPEANEPRPTTSFGETTQRYNSWVFNQQVNYDNQFGDHSVKVVALHEASLGNFRQIQGSLSSYFIESRNLWYLNTGFGDIQSRGVYSSGGSGPAKESYMGRVEYNYKGKYLLNATARYDQSSIFPIEKGRVFGGVGLAWQASDESFMQNVSWVKNLKLRLAYGVTGNDAIDGSRAYSAFGGSAANTAYDLNGTNTTTLPGYTATSLGNPALRWEQQVQKNFGLDATLLNNKLDVSFDIYDRQTVDFLFQRKFPGTFPYDVSTPYENIGQIDNSGFEFSLNWKDRINKDFDYSVGFNFTKNKNNIVDLAKEFGLDVLYPGVESRSGPLVRHEIGSPVSTFYGYTLDGIFQNAGEVAASNQPNAGVGRFRWKDINGDKKIDEKDKGIIGNPNPDFIFGINLTASYKGFDFSMFMTGSYGNDILNYTRYFTDFLTYDGNRSKRLLYESWTPTNTNAKLPLIDISDTYSSAPSSYYIEDGSYLRCKTLQIGYTFPTSFLSKYNISTARFYVQAQNLFTITRYGGLDPVIGSRTNGNAPDPYFGVDAGNYPSSKLMSVGLNLSF